MVAWFIPILIAVALTVVAYLIMPKAKAPQPVGTKDMESPTAEAGREIPVPFGTLTIKSPNCLWSGEKGRRSFKVNA